MKYLLDVNALIALGIKQHEHNLRIETWIAEFPKQSRPTFATCSITEIGFVRIVSQVSAYSFTLEDARNELLQLKQTKLLNFSFIPDGNDISNLPGWVKSHKQVTDGHLAQLAKSNEALLATLDENISGSFLIPK
jgi:predicted nucleic acid-binding protein